MAQVLAPIVQTTGSITMLHSSSDAYQNPSAPQPHHQQARSSQMPRGQVYNAQAGGAGYRGTSAPIAPYAFSSTPQLRQENRTTSAPNPQTLHQGNSPRLGHPTHPSSSSDSTASTSGSSGRSTGGPQYASKDDSVLDTKNDSVLGTSQLKKPTAESHSISPIQFSTSVPDLTLSTFDAPAKPHPDRYRRGARRTESSNSGVSSPNTAAPSQHSPLIGATTPPTAKDNVVPVLAAIDLQPPVRPGHNRASSVDDMQLPRQGSSESAKRYRRRSLSGFDAAVPLPADTAPIERLAGASGTAPAKRPTQEFRPSSSSSRQGSRPGSSHERQGSAGSVSSTTSRPSSRQEVPAVRTSAMRSPSPSARGGADPSRRSIGPSPLSKPMSSTEPAPSPRKAEQAAVLPSPAMQQLSALNDKDPGKGVKSRLRRAFSFGSAAELRRASAENNLSAERAKLRKDRYQNEHDAEQAAIVAQQEAAGIGAGIYSGQGGFTGSTDNLSISSTASSASVMLRKMGTSMKKGGKSIKGLFRPKSVIGVPAADGPVVQPSVAQVSMVTVEAERQKVNVNADPRDQVGGGTGYPRLERNSLDAGRRTSDANVASGPLVNEGMSRKSIVGGDRERAEVLSHIKRGILKRNETAPNASSPVRHGAPSTPIDERGRPVQVHTSGDYFAKPPRPMDAASSRSAPTTPQGSSRNISFSPRLLFHDVWSSSEYDRRGEIATCNRLTPMLAQQIKEELNSFKMEMEVHEASKPHTHFF